MTEIKNRDVIILKIYQREGDELRDYKIPVLPSHNIRDVKISIANHHKVFPQNVILKKLIEELPDEMTISNIKRSKKDEQNLIHLQAIIVREKDEEMKFNKQLNHENITNRIL